jgi:hypothetical protein
MLVDSDGSSLGVLCLEEEIGRYGRRVIAVVSMPSSCSRLTGSRHQNAENVQVCVLLLRRKAEHLVLPGPLRRQIGEASNAHTTGKSAVDGREWRLGKPSRYAQGRLPVLMLWTAPSNRT